MTQQLVRPRQAPEDQDTRAAAASMELVARFKAGDPDAFAEIYRRFYDQVFRFVNRRLNRNRQLAEDLTQEAFVRALGSLDRFQWQGTNVVAWLFTIARNLIADHFKKAQTRLEVLGTDVVDIGPAAVADGEEPDPQDTVLAYLRNVNLLTLLLELTADQQEVLVLRYLRGLSIAETSRVMGRDQGAVKALAYRASRSLQRLVEQQEAAA